MVLYSDLADAALDGDAVVITGASSGIGLEAARLLVRVHGAHVVMACRNLAKAAPLADELNAPGGRGRATVLQLDTADLASVRAFPAALSALRLPRLRALVLNAGVMFADNASGAQLPAELHFATNHLGHFLLAGLLLPELAAHPAGRVISVSSIAAHVRSGIDFTAAATRTPPPPAPAASLYTKIQAYSDSKLANLLFVHELARRLRAQGSPVTAVAAHPGYARTSLQTHMDGTLFGRFEAAAMRGWLSHDAVGGAHPLVLAVVDPDSDPDPSVYYAPSGRLELSGPASSRGGSMPRGVTDAAAADLWALSERLCGRNVL